MFDAHSATVSTASSLASAGQGTSHRSRRRRGPPRDPPRPPRGRRQRPVVKCAHRPGIKDRCGRRRAVQGARPRAQQVIKIVHEELIAPSAARPQASPMREAADRRPDGRASRAPARRPTRPSSPAGSNSRAATLLVGADLQTPGRGRAAARAGRPIDVPVFSAADDVVAVRCGRSPGRRRGTRRG